MIVKPDDLDLRALPEQTLLYAGVRASRPLGLELRITLERRRGAERLEQRRLFDPEAEVGFDLRLTYDAGPASGEVDGRHARHDVRPEARVAFHPKSARHGD